MITKQTEIDNVTILNDGRLNIKETLIILEDGIEISRTNSRRWVDVGDDVSTESQFIQDLVAGFHTPARVSSRAAAKAAEQAKVNTVQP
jgi:hypothetical protein